MNTLLRLTALVACWATAGLAAPPPAPPVSPSPPEAKSSATEYPLTCSELATPLVFKGWDALTNARLDEARDNLKLAIVSDPNCVMARASLGAITPGPQGRRLLHGALADRARLSEVELLHLQSIEAMRSADPQGAFQLAEQLADLAPDVLMVNLNLATAALALEEWAAAESAAERAAELSPTSGAGWNLLGYALLRARRTPEALEAFRKYGEVAPGEPNAHDSLGDALLADNQLEAAATSYQRAIDGSAGKFWPAWSGLATIKAIEGDWAGARAATSGQKAAAILPVDKMKADTLLAWSYAAQGKLADALKVTELAQKEAVAARVEWAVPHHQLLRGQLNLVSGKYAEAAKAFTAANHVKLGTRPDGARKEHRARALAGLAVAQARLGRQTEAVRALAALEEFSQANLSGPLATDLSSYARGVLALARQDARGAVTSLQRCSEPFDLCRFTLAEAQQEAGETAAGVKTREELLGANHRDPQYWFVRSRLAARMKESAM